MVLSAFSFALMAACIKLFLPTVPTGRTVFWRGVLMASTFFLIAKARGVSIGGTRHGKLVLRGLLGAGAVSCYFWSVQHLSIGDAVLIQYSHPVFVAVLAPLLLREKTGRGHWLWVATAFVGMWIVFRYGIGGGVKARVTAVEPIPATFAPPCSTASSWPSTSIFISTGTS